MTVSLAPVELTLALALLTTVSLLVLGTPIAWWLARSRAWWKLPVAAVIALPLVLPPTVLGFYLLLGLSPTGPLGRISEALGWGTLAFSFSGLWLGSMIYSLPFVVQPIQAAFEAMGDRPLEVAATLRCTPLQAFWRVALPLARPGYVSAMILGFAHTLGEFGVVLMIGGNIPGRTRVLSIALYDQVEAQRYGEAHALAGGLLVFSFVILLAFYAYNRRREVAWPR